MADAPVIHLTVPQAAFIDAAEPFVGFVGGVGSGKSFVLCYDLIRRACRGGLYMVAAPTFPMLRDATLRSFFDVAERIGMAVKFARTEMTARLPRSGAEVLFRSADDPDRMRGPNLSAVALDEASLMAPEAFSVSIGRLRQGGRFGVLRAAFTPKGRHHWTYDVFGTGRPDTGLIHARTADNPFLAPEFEETVRRQYTSVLAAQELGGEFVDVSGGQFDRAWVALVPVAPVSMIRVRYWDTASTEGGGAYSCGVLMGRTRAGRFVVEDVVRGQWSAANRRARMLATAQADRRRGDVITWVEQEPGGSGKEAVEDMIRVMAGYAVRADRVTGDKVTRFQPFAAQAEAGNVDVLDATWTEDYLSELTAFPAGAYKDQADATSGAFNKLAGVGCGDPSRIVPPPHLRTLVPVPTW